MSEQINTKHLHDIGACCQAIDWASTQPDWPTLWAVCDRADWMLWLSGQLSDCSSKRRTLVRCAADCSGTAVPYIHDEAIKAAAITCLQACNDWADDQIELVELMATRNAFLLVAPQHAVFGITTAASIAICAAADAADSVTYATSTVALAASYAATAASYAVNAVTPAARAATRTQALRDMADIVRRHYPSPPVPQAWHSAFETAGIAAV